MNNSKLLRWLALSSYVALVSVVLVWELYVAPATPVARGFWAGVKVVPLLIPLYWLFRGSAQAHLYAALLTLFYFSEGVSLTYVIMKTGNATQLVCVIGETIAALTFVVCAAYYARFNLRHATARFPE